jgi:hypothetical protein
MLDRISLVRDHRIGVCLDGLPLTEVDQALPYFTVGPYQRGLVSESTALLPILKFKPTGPVFYPAYGKQFFGLGVEVGACVKEPPAKVSSSVPDDDHFRKLGFRVIVCPQRAVATVRTYQMIDSIKSTEEFADQLRSCIQYALST